MVERADAPGGGAVGRATPEPTDAQQIGPPVGYEGRISAWLGRLTG